ncbi:MAG TPA: glycosyltransferase family 2 protein [Acidimicrobiales bacterium]|nr:glycosyltransferase family 2 protein [Acidimicrobiales bacterium]
MAALAEPQGAAEPQVAVSAVVVNYNAGLVLAECVASLRADGVAEVVVVDNGSRDDSLATLRQRDADTVWTEADENLGYGRAANLGARACHGRYLLVCNPDVVVRPGTVSALVARLDRDLGAGIVGPRLVNADGTLYPSARTFPSLGDALGHGLLGLFWPGNRFSRRYKLLDWDHTETRVVDWVSGAFLVVRRDVWDGIDGFDPGYFMYMEDVDLCWRASRAGWQVVYEPSAQVVHLQGLCTDRRPYRMILAHHRSLWRFAWRSTDGWRRALLPPIGLGLVARAAVACGGKWRADLKDLAHPNRGRSRRSIRPDRRVS